MNPPGKSRNQFAYYADEGVTNNVVVRLAGAFYTIDDIVPIDAGMGCTHPDGDLTFVSCDAAGVTIIDIRTKDGNDTVNNMSPMSAYVLGGDGNDAIWGGVADDYLYGGEGNDQLRGGPGDDTLEGNPGSDYMIGGDGSYDQASYRGSAAGVIADLIGDAGDGVPGENDTITSDVEILVGSDHNDVLYGNDQMNFLYGGRGQDVLNGLGGNDFLTGENQYGYTTTLFADEFHGGTGRDTVDYTDHSAAQRVFADADGALGDDGATGSMTPSTPTWRTSSDRPAPTSSPETTRPTRSGAARATTSSPASTAPTGSAATRATTPSTAAKATTCSRAATATTTCTGSGEWTNCTAVRAPMCVTRSATNGLFILDSSANILALNGYDNWLHLFSGAALLGLGLWSEKR